MIPYDYIYNHVLDIYKNFKKIEYPIDVLHLLSSLSNCRLISYQKLAYLNHCSMQDIISSCESKSGCTYYDKKNGRYLVMLNLSNENNNVPGRIRWTAAHELGHIVLKHFEYLTSESANGRRISDKINHLFESHANCFASVLLCPFPIYEYFNIISPDDVKRVFGLSTEASNIRWNEYTKWVQNHFETKWENDMKTLFKERYVNYFGISDKMIKVSKAR